MTLKRIRVYAPVIAITLWSIWIIDVSGAGVIDRLGKIKGTDFIQFYVAGSFLREARGDLLYDARAQYERAQAVAPGTPDIFYVPVQSPQTALAFAPLRSAVPARAPALAPLRSPAAPLGFSVLALAPAAVPRFAVPAVPRSPAGVADRF